MTETATLPTPAHLGRILHLILTDIRNWGDIHDRCPEHSEEITGLTPKIVAELADLAEIIPLQFINHDDRYLEGIVSTIQKFAAKYPFAQWYSAAMNMTSEEILHTVIPDAAHDWLTSEPTRSI